MPNPEQEQRLGEELTNPDQLALEGLEHHINVHELPANRHRVNHDTFIDDAHAAEVRDDGVVIQLGPFLKRFPSPEPPDIAA